MARIIRFPLKMKNGAEVRSLDELKENFDLESVLGYFTDGKLRTWLADRYYDEKAEAVAALSKDMPDLNAKLCEILEVEYQAEADDTDLEYIQKRNEKLKILSAVTADQDILKNIDLVAMNQDDLYDILDEGSDKVYLYGEKFEIPLGRKNTIYEGINLPLVILENNKDIINYEEAGIQFKKVSYERRINPYITKGEKLFLEGKYKEAFPLIEEAANNGNPRAMYIMARYCNDGNETVKINKKERNNWCEKAFRYKEPLSMYGYAYWCLKDEQSKLYSMIFNDIKSLAESGDILAQVIIGYMYEDGSGVEQDYAEAVKWYRKAAKQKNANAQCSLSYMYAYGYGVAQDYAEAFKWFRKAAEQGDAIGQSNLGYMYDNGHGIEQDKAKAVEWYRKAAEQGDARGQDNLGDMYYHGRGAAQDYAEAVKWYRKAAEQGYAYGQVNLGYMYSKGYGVTQDKAKAIEWYKKAAAQGNEAAKKNLKILGVTI